MVFNLSEEEFKVLALQLVGHSVKMIARTSDATNKRRLRDFCCTGTKTLQDLLNNIQDHSLGEFRIAKPNPSHLIYALYFLKKYPTAHEFAARCGVGTEKTVVSRAWKYVQAIQALKGHKIQWIFDNGNHKEFFILSVDGVHCRINEPRTEPSSGWYSKKFNKAGLV